MKNYFSLLIICAFVFCVTDLSARVKPIEIPGYYIKASGDSVKGKFLLPKVSETNDSLILYKLQFKAKFIHANGSVKKIRPRSGVKEVGIWYKGKTTTYHRVNNRRVLKGQGPGGMHSFAPLMMDGKIEVDRKSVV